MTPLTKPAKGSQKKSRKAAKGQEARLLKALRPAVQARDGGFCRLYALDAGVRQTIWAVVGPCVGVSELAHYGDWRRSSTRGMDPVNRHVQHGLLMLCAAHHRTGLHAYDGSLGGTRMQIEALTDRHTDGPLRFVVDGKAWTETV